MSSWKKHTAESDAKWKRERLKKSEKRERQKKKERMRIHRGYFWNGDFWLFSLYTCTVY